MKRFKHPFDEFARLMITAFLMGATMTCIGVALALVVTAQPEEEMLDLMFWPAAAAVSFSVSLYTLWITEPVKYRIETPQPRKEK